MCVSVEDVYVDELNEGECSFREERKKLRRESRREEGIRWNDMCM